MADITKLGLEVESKNVRRATKDLDRFQAEANRKRSEAASEGRVGRASITKPESHEDPVTKEQRYIAWKEQEEGEFGDRTECAATKPHSDAGREAKAQASNTNRGAVERGDSLADKRPDLAAKVRSGEMKPAAAHRQMKQDSVSEHVAELPDNQYTVIYADPPWKYNDAQAVKGDYGTGTGAANSHYPSMTLSELKALDVASLAADNCVLFLWATSPLLPDSLELVRAWGFKYKASFVWDKIKHNMGHYNSVRHEFLLVCTKGSNGSATTACYGPVCCSATATRWRQWISRAQASSPSKNTRSVRLECHG